MVRAGHVAGLVAAGLSTFALAGCPDSYTCYDYRTCTPDGGADAKADVHADARTDVAQKHHDAGVDATTDGRTHEGGAPDVSAPDVATSDAKTSDAANDVGVDSYTCDGTQPPSTEACVISETYGVFVAPTANGGSDTTGSGSRAAPYATVGHGLQNAAGKRVYVCGATYAEQLTVISPVSVYGGLACPTGASGDWGYTGTAASVAPSVPGYALDVESVTGAHFEDMAFASTDANAGDAGAPGASSIAVMVDASTGVSFTRVSATAGAGMKGGNAGAMPTNACSTSLNGGAAPAGGGGTTPVSCTCPVFGSSRGGAGGADNEQGGPGTSVPAITGTAPNDGKGGPGAADPATCGNGDNGAIGVAGAAGLSGAAGSLSSTG